MARRRMIDPNLWQSEDVAKLTVRQRLLLIGLFSNSDDHGRGRAKASYVRSTIFPYDDLTIADIEVDLQEIAKFISIVFYEVDGNSYYSFANWEKWQTVQKPQHSLIPDPVENDSILSQESVQNDSRLKERKGKERKVEEVEVNAREGKNIPPRPQHNYSLCKIFEQNFGRLLSPIEGEEINKMADEHSQELAEHALKVAILNNARSIKYIQTILNGWHAKGFTTVFEVQAYEERREQLKQGIDSTKADVDKSISLADAKAEKEQKRRAEVIQAAINYITLVEKFPPDDPQAIECAKGYDDAIPGVSVDIIAELQKMGGLQHGIN